MFYFVCESFDFMWSIWPEIRCTKHQFAESIHTCFTVYGHNESNGFVIRIFDGREINQLGAPLNEGLVDGDKSGILRVSSQWLTDLLLNWKI